MHPQIDAVSDADMPGERSPGRHDTPVTDLNVVFDADTVHHEAIVTDFSASFAALVDGGQFTDCGSGADADSEARAVGPRGGMVCAEDLRWCSQHGSRPDPAVVADVEWTGQDCVRSDRYTGPDQYFGADHGGGMDMAVRS